MTWNIRGGQTEKRGGVFKVEYAQVTNKQKLFDVFDLEKPDAGRDFNQAPDHLPIVAHMSYR